MKKTVNNEKENVLKSTFSQAPFEFSRKTPRELFRSSPLLFEFKLYDVEKKKTRGGRLSGVGKLSSKSMGFWKNSRNSTRTNDNYSGEDKQSSTSSQHPFPHDEKDGLYRKHQGQLLYDTDKRAKPHRCNDRLEDVICSLYAGGNVFLTVPKVWSTFTECLRSKEGEEPDVPYVYHTPPSSNLRQNRRKT